MVQVHSLFKLTLRGREIAGQLARPGASERRALRHKAISSFLRNLILGPLALIYMVAIMRQTFS